MKTKIGISFVLGLLFVGYLYTADKAVQAQSVKPEQRTTFRCSTLVSTATTLTELTGCAAGAAACAP